MKTTLICLLILSCSLAIVKALDNGLTRTPPMGWLAWERFRCVTDCKNYPNDCISEKLFTDMADQLVKTGLKDLGYNLVNIDDCWLAMQRNAQGKLYPDPERFPHGIKWLADYMHTRGLKLGIYEDFGNFTCGGYPGTTLKYIETDANTFASWEVDMLKLDGCYVDTKDMPIGYPQMTKALNATGRPIIYSCSWPAYMIDDPKIPWDTIGKSCNLWRLYDDIDDSWESVYSIIQYWAKKQDILAPLAKPGQWNDPDMLIIGDFSLSFEESKSQFAIWAIIAAPLFMSNDLRTISPEALSILSNKEIIAVNQDKAGIQGKRVWAGSMTEIWVRPLSDGSVAVVFFNGQPYGTPVPMSATFAMIGLKATKATARDLYLHTDLGVVSGSIAIKAVNPHGVVMIKLTPTA